MCYGDDALAPFPPIRGGADDRGDLVLESADGTKFGAYYAHPDTPSTRAVVILPDVRGLHNFYKDLAVRFAEASLHAVAIDYFGRTAGIGARGEDFSFREHVDQMAYKNVDADVAAAVGWLKALPGVKVDAVFAVGFCLGGAQSWHQSAAGHGLKGCVGFYGPPQRIEDMWKDMRVPCLLLAAGNDTHLLEPAQQMVATLEANGVEAELHVYEGAPHSFFDRTFDENQDACDDAWRRVLAFFDAHA